ncbi:4'-phosphopantetheinyl transferase superfamily protein [Chryseolinea sp. T2]|uniref:4'-phosphopantetheinyl transferase family protein n=1 Tax=Chryseolinea sp. T2 TaxID=3129255 RepID=UPI0030776AF8
MPLEKIVIEEDRAWALWRVTEDEESLRHKLPEVEAFPENIAHASKRIEWLAGRVLLMTLFEALSLPFKGITKNDFGKPFPTDSDHHLSLSHSFPFVAAIVDKNGPAGIDLEQPKVKLFKVAHRIFHKRELKDAGNDLIKHCVYWCAKETLVKIYGKKDLTFAEHLLIDPFQLGEEGDIRGRIIVGGIESVIPLHYEVYPGFVLVFNRSVNL